MSAALMGCVCPVPACVIHGFVFTLSCSATRSLGSPMREGPKWRRGREVGCMQAS
jgi:hypothetical protein